VTPIVRSALLGYAGLWKQEGKSEAALALLFAILQYPASPKAAQDHAEKLRSESEAHLPDQQIDAIRAQVQAKPLEARTQEILSSL